MVLRQTPLDLNGPVLGFTTHPVSATVSIANSAQFTGFATATFPEQTPANPAANDGTIVYKWYNSEFGELSDGTLEGATITGSGTTILTIENATSNTINGTGFYLTAGYTPSAYSQPAGSAVVAGTARSTANAVNEPLASNSAILTVRPTLSITLQPQE